MTRFQVKTLTNLAFFYKTFYLDIHGSSLLTLSLSDLRSLGIDSLTDRINLLHKILVLKDGYRRLSVEIEVNPKRNGTVMEQEVFERVESLQERLVEGDDELVKLLLLFLV